MECVIKKKMMPLYMVVVCYLIESIKIVKMDPFDDRVLCFNPFIFFFGKFIVVVVVFN